MIPDVNPRDIGICVKFSELMHRENAFRKELRRRRSSLDAQSSDAFLLRLPDVFVYLQVQARIQPIGQHPFDQLARIQQAIHR